MRRIDFVGVDEQVMDMIRPGLVRPHLGNCSSYYYGCCTYHYHFHQCY